MITQVYACYFQHLFSPLDWEPSEGRSEPYSSSFVFPGTEEILNKGWQVGERRKALCSLKARFMGVERKRSKSLDGQEPEHRIQSVFS